MKNIQSIMQHFAPTLASALGGPFSGIASKFIADNLAGGSSSDGMKSDEIVAELLNDSSNLKKFKELDKKFKLEMNSVGVDVFSLETNNTKDAISLAKINNKPQIVISVLFLSAYFLMLAAIFAIEASDTLNMKQGDNSLLGELQILFGVLTAGVGQVLSFWFGGVLKKHDPVAK